MNKLGLRFKVANWIMKDKLRYCLACVNYNAKEIDNLLKSESSNEVKIYGSKMYAKKINNKIEELFYM